MIDLRVSALVALFLLAAPASVSAGEPAWDLGGPLVIEGAGEGVVLSGPAAKWVRAAHAQRRTAARGDRVGPTLAEHLREYRWRVEAARFLELVAGQGPSAGFAPRF